MDEPGGRVAGDGGGGRDQRADRVCRTGLPASGAVDRRERSAQATAIGDGAGSGIARDGRCGIAKTFRPGRDRDASAGGRVDRLARRAVFLAALVAESPPRCEELNHEVTKTRSLYLRKTASCLRDFVV